MKQLILIIFLITLLWGCSPQNENTDKIVVSPSLLTNLAEIINHEDSLAESIPTHSVIKSFLITFCETEGGCYIMIEGDFEYYDSKAMNGYFTYMGKMVSVYGITENCGGRFINQEKLTRGKIKGLIDFDNKNFDNAIKFNVPPPKPPPPREPYFRTYLIVNNDSLQLINEFIYNRE